MTVVNDDGTVFNVRVVRTGERYGRTDRLVHSGAVPLVEFYDAEHASPASPRGQMVSSYYLDDVARTAAGGHGLNLDGGIKRWWVSAQNVRDVVEYATRETS